MFDVGTIVSSVEIFLLRAEGCFGVGRTIVTICFNTDTCSLVWNVTRLQSLTRAHYGLEGGMTFQTNTSSHGIQKTQPVEQNLADTLYL